MQILEKIWYTTPSDFCPYDKQFVVKNSDDEDDEDDEEDSGDEDEYLEEEMF